MKKITRNIGIGIYSELKSKNISVEEAAMLFGYSVRDMYRLIEGRLFISPKALEEIAGKLDTRVDLLINFMPDSNKLLPELEYNKTFSSEDNLYTIIDLLDEYIELKEQV